MQGYRSPMRNLRFTEHGRIRKQRRIKNGGTGKKQKQHKRNRTLFEMVSDFMSGR
jgi:hypothetical protein